MVYQSLLKNESNSIYVEPLHMDPLHLSPESWKKRVPTILISSAISILLVFAVLGVSSASTNPLTSSTSGNIRTHLASANIPASVVSPCEDVLPLTPTQSDYCMNSGGDSISYEMNPTLTCIQQYICNGGSFSLPLQLVVTNLDSSLTENESESEQESGTPENSLIQHDVALNARMSFSAVSTPAQIIDLSYEPTGPVPSGCLSLTGGTVYFKVTKISVSSYTAGLWGTAQGSSIYIPVLLGSNIAYASSTAPTYTGWAYVPNLLLSSRFLTQYCSKTAPRSFTYPFFYFSGGVNKGYALVDLSAQIYQK